MNQDKIVEMMGNIVDMPLEDFEKQLKEQKVNIGTMNNIILNLESIYYELRIRKDKILEKVFKGDLIIEDSDVKKSLEGLYAEMTKAEQKITYLKQRTKKLLKDI